MNLSKIFGILRLGFGHKKITSNEPWNTETHKTDRNLPITNHKQWPFHPLPENFRFLKGPLRWLASDIFLTRGSKCTNHRKTVLIACFLRGHLNILCPFSFAYFVIGRFCYVEWIIQWETSWISFDPKFFEEADWITFGRGFSRNVLINIVQSCYRGVARGGFQGFRNPPSRAKEPPSPIFNSDFIPARV